MSANNKDLHKLTLVENGNEVHLDGIKIKGLKSFKIENSTFGAVKFSMELLVSPENFLRN
jgi:hypothetical protein